MNNYTYIFVAVALTNVGCGKSRISEPAKIHIAELTECYFQAQIFPDEVNSLPDGYFEAAIDIVDEKYKSNIAYFGFKESPVSHMSFAILSECENSDEMARNIVRDVNIVAQAIKPRLTIGEPIIITKEQAQTGN